VFVNGASGGVGTAAVQLARYRGLRIVATAGTERGLALVREQGADHVLSHKEPDYIERVPSLIGGKGPDVILEMLANVNLDRDLDILGLRGRVVLVGNRGTIEINPRKLMGKDGTIVGLTMFNATPEEFRETHAALGAGLACGALKPVVGREIPLAQAVQAHVAVMEPGAYGKIVMIP
jgi:NADPH2:quinone reductase